MAYKLTPGGNNIKWNSNINRRMGEQARDAEESNYVYPPFVKQATETREYLLTSHPQQMSPGGIDCIYLH